MNLEDQPFISLTKTILAVSTQEVSQRAKGNLRAISDLSLEGVGPVKLNQATRALLLPWNSTAGLGRMQGYHTVVSFVGAFGDLKLRFLG